MPHENGRASSADREGSQQVISSRNYFAARGGSILLRGDIGVFLIRVGISLAASYNPDNRPFVPKCAGKVLVQAHLVIVFSLTRETEAG
jgi:hypothetical protein